MMFTAYPWQFDQFEQLIGIFRQGRLPHALLLQGEPGLGKRHFAQALAQLILCESEQSADAMQPCGSCKACQLYAASTHPDALNVQLEEKATQIKVDQIRQLSQFLSQTSHRQGMQVVIIEPAESMNINAANALLKSLEEPTANTLIILITHAADSLLATIRSRCQMIDVARPSQSQANEWLSPYISEPQKRMQLLQLANGNPLLARTFDEQAYLATYQRIADYISAILQGQTPSPIGIADYCSKQDALQAIHALQRLIGQTIHYAHAVAADDICPLQPFAERFRRPPFALKAYSFIDDINQSKQQLLSVSNPNPALLFESLFIRAQALFRLC